MGCISIPSLIWAWDNAVEVLVIIRFDHVLVLLAEIVVVTIYLLGVYDWQDMIDCQKLGANS